MVDKSKVVIKKAFEDRFRSLLGDDYDDFMRANLSFMKRSVRVNTLKSDVDSVKKELFDWSFTSIPWCPLGFYIEHVEGRRDIGNTFSHFIGNIYVQEAASMIPPLVLDPKPGDVILDMCASPGSKASQIAAMMDNSGVLVANDYKAERLAPLRINLQRMGVTNNIITLSQGERIQGQFDKILLDAPCSGTGNIRRSFKTLLIYNTHMITKLASTQKQLITSAFNALKVGGTLVYSTCSVEPEENEGVINFLLNKFDNARIEPISLNIKRGAPILHFEKYSYHESIKDALRLWPHNNDTEGFFVVKVRKVA